VRVLPPPQWLIQRHERVRFSKGTPYYSPEAFFSRLEEQSKESSESAVGVGALDYVRHIPPNIGNIRNLVFLYIAYNPIQTLPNEIGSLSNLRTLTIINTSLSSLPESIGNLSHLEELSLMGNNIRHLPESIGKLKNLRALNLAYNKLDSLPSTLADLENLELLDVTGNRLRSFPPLLPPRLNTMFIGDNHISVNRIEEIYAKIQPMALFY